jgi:hypothetical protein
MEKRHLKLDISKKTHRISFLTMSRLKVVTTLEQILKKVLYLLGYFAVSPGSYRRFEGTVLLPSFCNSLKVVMS